MTDPVEITKTVQVYRVYIKAPPEAIWDAITKPEWTVQYGYAPIVEYDLRPGGAFRAHCERGDEGLPRDPRRHRRWRGARGRRAAPAGPDVADALRRRGSPASL